LLSRLLCAQSGLSDPFEALAANYFAEIQDVLTAPWGVALTDFAYPQTTGTPPADIQQRYAVRDIAGAFAMFLQGVIPRRR
jgi:uncharacterized protein (DUF1810 family)